MVKPLVMASLMLVTIACTSSSAADESKAPVPAPQREVLPKGIELPLPGNTPEAAKKEEPGAKPDAAKKSE
jgi:hypothetical protein